MNLSQENLDAILASVLAVNCYGLEKAYSLLPSFRKFGLTDPSKISRTNVGEVMTQLYTAGYNRGLLTEMMAGRLVDLMKAVNSGDLEGFDELVALGKKQEAIKLLCNVKGIGPKVSADVWMLVSGVDR